MGPAQGRRVRLHAHYHEGLAEAEHFGCSRPSRNHYSQSRTPPALGQGKTSSRSQPAAGPLPRTPLIRGSESKTSSMRPFSVCMEQRRLLKPRSVISPPRPLSQLRVSVPAPARRSALQRLTRPRPIRVSSSWDHHSARITLKLRLCCLPTTLSGASNSRVNSQPPRFVTGTAVAPSCRSSQPGSSTPCISASSRTFSGRASISRSKESAAGLWNPVPRSHRTTVFLPVPSSSSNRRCGSR